MLSRRLLTTSLLAGLLVSPGSYAITPSEVHHQARAVIAELEAAKQKLAPGKAVRQPGIQVGKTPLHVYSKTLELIEKIRRYQREQGLPLTALPELPSGKITPNNVFSLVSQAKNALAQANGKKKIKVEFTEQQQFGMTPSDVYEQVWQASYLMDSLVAPLKPHDVLRNAQMIEKGLVDLAKSMKVNLKPASQVNSTGKTPTDVNIEAYRVLYKLAKLQRKLNMPPSLVPSFPSGKVLPEDVYDTTGNILAELIRINTHSGNGLKIARIDTPKGKITPSDVYRQMHKLNQLTAQLIR